MPLPTSDGASVALYVHFPYCLSICPYCDFDRQASGFDRIDAYLDAVAREISDAAQPSRPAHSIFFGGGTPSLMTPSQVDGILSALRDAFEVLPGAEVTLESNPGDANLDRMRAFHDLGVTRLSFGVQSLDDQELQVLGRRHSAAEARQAAAWAVSCGLQFNLDFMYGLPSQTLSRWTHTLSEAVTLGPTHLSCYALTLDEHVPLGRDVLRGTVKLPSDDAAADMYEVAGVLLGRAGYEQYEISNWARPGGMSRHNLTYWRDETWLGFGAGAASSDKGHRWKNTPVVERFIRAVNASQTDRVEDEAPDLATRLCDSLALSLRLREGVSFHQLQEKFGIDLHEALAGRTARLLEAGVLTIADGRLRIAAEYQLMTNDVLADLWLDIRESCRKPMNGGRAALRKSPAGESAPARAHPRPGAP